MGDAAHLGSDGDYGSFVPRLVADWVAEAPDERYRQTPGSMVFTDLSGFTAMSEQLAALGKVGAEELTHHLDDVFTSLLEVAGGYGASLLKFGGDALLLFFWGDDHELRAAASAIEMQQRLAEVGRITTGTGRMRLTMTVGAHAGDFDFFLVGDSHRELLVCGPAASRTVALEASAQPGQVIVSGAISKAVRKVDSRAVGPRRGRGVLLERAPRGVTTVDVADGGWPEQLDSARHVPALLRKEIAGGVVLPEHRQMVVGFCHLGNVDALLRERGPDFTAEALEGLMASMQEVCTEHGVAFVSSDVYDDGPKLILSTGAVRAWENDDERLLRALREVLDLEAPVEVRAGVHRGHGFRGPIGPPWRRTFAVMGDVVNTAARVMAKAGLGELLSTQGPLDRSDTLFATEELPPFAAKGKSAPLVAFRVGEITGIRDHRADRQVPLLGRDEELATLREAVDDARRGLGRAVEVVGEPGMGKTRLVDELVATVDGVRVVQVECGPYSQATAYFPFRVLVADLVRGFAEDDLRSTVRQRAPDLEPWLPFLGVLLGLDLHATPETEAIDSQFARAQLQRVALELVEALVDEPTLWVVGDLHWSDEASLELLDALIPKLEHVPLMLLTTSRTETELAVDERVKVTPLDEEASADLIRAASPRPLLPQHIGALAERAAGNPLFLHELAVALDEDVDVDEVPDSVEALVATRLDALPATDRRLVRELAVLGLNTNRDTARAVIEDVPERDDVVRWQRLESFVHPAGDRIQFRHAMVREVAYGGLSFKERKSVHLAAGRYLETLPDPDQHAALLAQHFHHGGDAERALRFSTVAARQAEDAFAYESASTLWGWATQAARRSGARDKCCGLLISQGDALRLSGEYTRAADAFRRARRFASKPIEEAALASKLVGIAQLLFDQRMRGRWERLALSELQRCEPDSEAASLRATVHLDRSITNFQRSDFACALANADHAIDLATTAKNDVLHTRCLVQRFRVLSRLGSEEAAFAGEQAERAARKIGYRRAEAVILSSRAQAMFSKGDWAHAREEFEKAITLYEEAGDTVNLAITRGNLGELLMEVGQHEAGLAHLKAAVATLRAASTWAAHTAAAHLGRAQIKSGEPEEGLATLEKSIRDLDQFGIHDDRVVAEVWLAEGLLALGQPGRAALVLEKALRSPHCPLALANRLRAAVLLFQRRPNEAISALEEAIQAAEREPSLLEWSRAVIELDALSTQGDPRVEEARATLDRLGVPYEREETPAS